MPRPAYDQSERLEIESRIRTVAVELFAEKGYRNVSMREIAKGLGWSAPALYRYYENKDALLSAIRAEGFLEIRDMLKNVRELASLPDEAVAHGVKAYVDYALNRSELYQLMYELDQGDVSSSPEVAVNRGQAFAQAIAIAEDVLRVSDRPGDAVEMAHLMWISAHGLAALAVANQLDLGKRLDELVEPTVQVLVKGMSEENRNV